MTVQDKHICATLGAIWNGLELNGDANEETLAEIDDITDVFGFRISERFVEDNYEQDGVPEWSSENSFGVLWTADAQTPWGYAASITRKLRA